jgi:hypothetical protein
MAYPFVAVVSEAGDYLHFDDAPAFYRYLKKFAATEVIVTVKRRPRRQGTQAMRYYRGVVVPDIAHACGVTDPDDYEGVHDALAWKFLKLPDSAFGTPRRRSTAKDELAQDELSKYIDEVITYAETSIPGCRVRRPEEVEIDDVVDPGWR